jgi:hypothetical protein
MSLIVLNDWFINEDKSIIYYDTKCVSELSTGNKKLVVPASSLAAVAGTDNEPRSVMMYEHRILFQSGKNKVFESTQFEGYQFSYKQGKNYYTIVMSRGRRRQAAPTVVAPVIATPTTPAKKTEKQYRVLTFAQTQDDVEILLGLKEASVQEPVQEPVQVSVQESVQEPVQVVELQEVVSQ